MNRRYRPPRKKSNHTVPLAAAGLTVAALALWGLFAKGQDIILFFKGETIVVPSNAEANANLSRLLGDLSGDKARLLELAENSRARLGWIENADTQRQFRWFLMSRLVDKGLWQEAVRILPEVESLAPVEGLDRLAAADVKNISLTDFDAMAEAAAEAGYIKDEDIARLIAFRNNPSDESWINGGAN